MQSNDKLKYVFSAATGVLLALAFPPLPFFFLVFIGFLPLFFVLDTAPAHRLRHIYTAFFFFHAVSNWWIASWQTDSDPWLVASGIAVAIGHPVFFLVPFVFLAFFRKRIGNERGLWAFPFIWAGFEWLHGQGDLAYSWLSLGHSQIHHSYWVQFADIIGTYGLSFLIALTNVILYKLACNLIEEKRKNPTKSFPAFDLKAKKLALSAILIILIPSGYGVFRLNEFSHAKMMADKPHISVAVIQPNINPWKKWEQGALPQIQMRKHLADSACALTSAPDLIVWDETAITFLSEDINCNHDFAFIADWLRSRKSTLLTGFTDLKIYDNPEDASPLAREFGKTGKLYDGYNSAVVVSPDSMTKAEIYHKMRLTPFGEQVPFGQYISFATRWMEWGVGISSWTKGTLQRNLTVTANNGIKYSVAPIICIESIFPDFVRNFSRDGAEVFAVITNDAWYDGTFGPEQHFQIAAMRAIENRRYVCRSANTGVSGFISAEGKAIARLEPRKPGAIIRDVPMISEVTVYARIGDILPIASAIAVFFAWLFLLIKKSSR
jgi:apolipoprotein N-acyltransferase